MINQIKAVQKIDRHILPHAEKQALIQIAILIFENNLTPDNQTIGDGIGENKDYVKNILARLKNKGFLKLNGRGKNRRIDILWPKIFGNSQLPNEAFSNSQLPNQAPKSTIPIIDKVVVVLLEKYRFDFGPVTLKKLSRFPVSDQLKAIESTKSNAKKNPETYINRILDNGCKGIKLADNKTKTSYDIAKEEQQKFNARMGIDEFEPITKEEIRQMRDNKTAGYSH